MVFLVCGTISCFYYECMRTMPPEKIIASERRHNIEDEVEHQQHNNDR